MPIWHPVWDTATIWKSWSKLGWLTKEWLRGQLSLWRAAEALEPGCPPWPSLVVQRLNAVSLVLAHGVPMAGFFFLPHLVAWNCTSVKMGLNSARVMINARVQKAQRRQRHGCMFACPSLLCSLYLASLSDPSVAATPLAGILELSSWGQECSWGGGWEESLACYLQSQSASPGPRDR